METTRRSFVKQIVMASTMSTIVPLLSCAKTNTRRLEHFGFISGILRNELKGGDWQAALREARSFGFTEYEGGQLGESPIEFLSFCKDTGLRPAS